MPDEFELDSLRGAIAEARAGWTADLTSMLRLAPEDRHGRFGVSLDQADLERLRAQPAPDITDIAARAILDPAVRDQDEAVQVARRIVTTTAELQEVTAKTLPNRFIPRPLWWWSVDCWTCPRPSF